MKDYFYQLTGTMPASFGKGDVRVKLVGRFPLDRDAVEADARKAAIETYPGLTVDTIKFEVVSHDERSPRNYAIYQRAAHGKRRLSFRERVWSVRAASDMAMAMNPPGIVIDLISRRVIAKGQKCCNHKLPEGIKDLPPIERYDEDHKQ